MLRLIRIRQISPHLMWPSLGQLFKLEILFSVYQKEVVPLHAVKLTHVKEARAFAPPSVPDVISLTGGGPLSPD